nr:hypothetical protein [Tanacetum cinerariifolium]
MYRASNLKCIKILDKELEELKLKKDGLDGQLAGLLKASKNLNHLIECQRFDQVKEGVGYNAVPPPAADLYLSPKKDLSWTGLEFVLHKKPCFNCGDFSHLANDCRQKVQRETSRKFPTASKKFTTGSTKNHTVDMGRKGKAVKPSAC